MSIRPQILIIVLIIPLFVAKRVCGQEEADLLLQDLLDLSMDQMKERSLDSAEQSLRLGQRLLLETEDLLLHSKVNNNLGLLHYYRGNYDSAIWYYKLSLKFDKDELKDSGRVASRLKNLGLCYKKQSRYRVAMSYYTEAYQYAQTMGDTSQLASIHNSLGNLHHVLDNHAEALEHFQLSLDIWEHEERYAKMAMARNNLGNVYLALEDYEAALTQYEASLALKNRMSDDASLAITFGNIGEAYMGMDSLLIAEQYLKNAIELKAENDDLFGLAFSFNKMARLCIAKQDLAAAAYFVSQADSLATALQAGNIAIECLDIRKQLLLAKSEFGEALQIDSRLDDLRDSLFKTEKLEALEWEAEFQIDLTKQETEIARQEAKLANLDAQRRSEWIVWISVVAFLLIAGTTIIIVLSRKTLAQQRQIGQLLASENQLLAITQNTFLHQKKNDYQRLLNTLRKAMRKSKTNDLKLVEGMLFSFAILDDHLYANPQTERVDLKPFLTKLTDELPNFLDSTGRVDVQTSFEHCYASPNIGRSIAYIIAELSINAHRHRAKKSNDLLKLGIETKVEGHKFKVAFRDNNAERMPADFIDEPKGRGGELVKQFLTLIHGSYRISYEDGNIVEIAFDMKSLQGEHGNKNNT